MRRLITIVTISLLAASTVEAAAPTSISVQGKLTDAVGVPLPSGAKNFIFKIFDAPTLGSELWPNGPGENQSVTSDVSGLWSARVGAVIPLSDEVFQDTVRWLEINVDGTLMPRVRLLTGPYAYRVSTVDGASGGTITSPVSIGSGHFNSGAGGFVAGTNNTVNADHATVTGGLGNYATGVGAVIGGGANNRARGSYAVVAGGGADGTDSNSANGNWSTVSGGLRNGNTGYLATIGGGFWNRLTDFGAYSTIGGGYHNTIDGFYATITGGQDNYSTGFYSAIGGGSYNRAYAYGATVVGGGSGLPVDSNVARGDFSTVLGGTRNIASARWSLAAGHRARSNHIATFVWADSTSADFASTGPGQFLIRARGGVGIGTNFPQTASGGQVLHINNPNGPSVLRLDDGELNGIQWEIQSTVYDGIGTINLSNITAFTNPFQFYANGNFAASGNITAVGNICAFNHACPSDERLKEDIHRLQDPLQRLNQLRGVEYRWSTDARRQRSLPDEEQIGLLAQEVRKVVPQAVIEQSDGYLAVDYARLVPLLIESIKEQQKQIDELKSHLDRRSP